tara:strand:+ start:3064 stop:3480 length:417 start_codon:yes stop_codon:yes gene_type:complete
MMSWLTWEATKLFAKKAWVWCKHHWKIVALVVWTIVIWFVSRKNSQVALKVLETARNSYQEEIDAVNKTHEEEIRKRDEAIERYNNVLDSIEQNYEESKEKLTFEKRARIKELIDSHGSDKSALNDALKEEFGFEYVE